MTCAHRSAYECLHCNTRCCMDCHAPMPDPDGEVKTAVRWCKAPACIEDEAKAMGIPFARNMARRS